jgi:hypothetical protein
MPPLARRNLFHDKIRLALTLTGITFAVLLVVVELGLFLGFSTTTSSLIDRSRADLRSPPGMCPTSSRAHHFPNASSTRFAQLPASPPRRSTSRDLRAGSINSRIALPSI